MTQRASPGSSNNWNGRGPGPGAYATSWTAWYNEEVRRRKPKRKERNEFMNKYKYVIGSEDDFASFEELTKCMSNGIFDAGGRNAACFDFQLPNIEAPGFDNDDVAILVGQGLAFETGWCFDDVISFLTKYDGEKYSIIITV
jgi:hypothetical protein